MNEQLVQIIIRNRLDTMTYTTRQEGTPKEQALKEAREWLEEADRGLPVADETGYVSASSFGIEVSVNGQKFRVEFSPEVIWTSAASELP